MTDDTIAVPSLLEKSADTTLLREVIGFAARQMMKLEAKGLCGGARGERDPERLNQRNDYRGRGW